MQTRLRHGASWVDYWEAGKEDCIIIIHLQVVGLEPMTHGSRAQDPNQGLGNHQYLTLPDPVNLRHKGHVHVSMY